jgi:hypothetical protein
MTHAHRCARRFCACVEREAVRLYGRHGVRSRRQRGNAIVFIATRVLSRETIDGQRRHCV